MIQHLYNSRGVWVAFAKDRYLFDRECRWIGWLPWDDGEAVDRQGDYLGTITDRNRLYRLAIRQHREYPGYPGYPGRPEHPGYPGFAGPDDPLPYGAEDVEIAVPVL